MTHTLDEQQVHAWLSNLFADCSGLINIVSSGNWAGKSFRTVDDAVTYIKLLEKRQPQGIYARATTVAHQPDKGRGTADISKEFIGFWADLDIAGPGHKWHVCDATNCSGLCHDDDCPKRPNGDCRHHTTNLTPLLPDQAACLELIDLTGLPAPTEWIHSGGGMYPWWLLTQPRELGESLKVAAEASAKWQWLIEAAARKMGYHYGSGVGDLSRVLRIPGTINRKIPDSPVRAEWRMELSDSTPYDIIDLHSRLRIAADRFEAPRIPVTRPEPKPLPATSGQRPGDAYNAATTWRQLLEADGAQIDSEHGDYIEWVRPGKDRRDGISATSGYQGTHLLHVFTDAWHPLRQGEDYDRFGYYVATRHNGDFRAATRQLAAEGFGDKYPATRITAADYLDDGYRDGDEDFHEGDEPASALQAILDAAPKGHATKPANRTYSWTDSGVADLMELRHGDEWRYCAERGLNHFDKGWLRWDGTRWTADIRGTVTDQVNTIVSEAYNDTDSIEDEKKRERTRSAIRPMLSNAKQVGTTRMFARRRAIAVAADQLDAIHNRLTCLSGTLNTDTWEHSGFDRTLLATKRLGVAYDPAATAPGWTRFLEQVLPDPDIRDYLQRAAGYTLLGNPVAKAIFLLHGESNTGKSQVINVLRGIFGDFAASTKEQTFRQNDSATSATPGLHKLRGARLVTASETNQGVKLDEVLIKQITGGDDVDSRGLYQDEETWKPQFSMWLATNFLPKFNSDDNALWRRVKPIHFKVVFGAAGGPSEVLDIGRKLLAEEGSGILNWVLDGVRKYRERGLEQPQELDESVRAYQRDSDEVARFIDHATSEGLIVVGEQETVESRTLYAQYTAWCADEGIKYPFAANRFGRRLVSLGFGNVRDSTRTKRMWRGIGIGGNAVGVWVGSGLPLRT